MTSLDGDQVGFETEDFLTLNRGATLYDSNNNERGRIEQKVISIGYKFKIYEGDEQVGTTEQNFSLGLKADVKDMDGNVEYEVEKAMFSIGADVEITAVEDGESRDVDAIDAVWNTVVMSEIDEAARSK